MGSREPIESWQDLPVADVVQRIERGLAVRARDEVELETHRRAAVLVPVIVRESELHLMFTLRSAALRSHSGQISFPGGRTDDADAHAVATAIREAQEEVGIDPRAVRVLGFLDDVPTPTGYVITPVVGLLEPAPSTYTPNAAEVAEVFEVAIARLADPAIFRARGEVERWGRRFQIVAYEIDGRNIWGATARIVSQLLALL